MIFPEARSRVYSHESWLYDDRYPSREKILEIIDAWRDGVKGIRLNEVFLGDHHQPAFKTDRLFYLPKETDVLVEVLAEMSVIGYRTYAVSNDVLAGIFFIRDPEHRTDIDADYIQAVIDHSRKVCNVGLEYARKRAEDRFKEGA